TGTSLDRDLEIRLDQRPGGLGNQGNPAFAGKALLRNANLHIWPAGLYELILAAHPATSGPPAPGGRTPQDRSKLAPRRRVRRGPERRSRLDSAGVGRSAAPRRGVRPS